MYELSAAVVDLPPHDPEDVAHLPRLPVLEGLLARADRLDPTSDWRRFALRSVSFDWPAGDLPLARALAECAGLARVGTYLQLSPQHLIAGLSSVHYDPKGPVAVDPTTLEALCDAYALEFGDDPVALRCVEGQLLLYSARPRDVVTHDPAGLAGRSLAEGVPSGPDARWLRARLSELELWLHERGVRGRDGRTVNGFHAHGAGHALPGEPLRWPHLLAPDPGLAALVRANAGHVDARHALDVWSFAALAARGRPFVAADEAWFAPLGARLRDGEVGVAHLWIAGRCFRFRAGHRWRLFRRIRPWWEWLV